jgi:hypothetical protein
LFRKLLVLLGKQVISPIENLPGLSAQILLLTHVRKVLFFGRLLAVEIMEVVEDLGDTIMIAKNGTRT